MSDLTSNWAPATGDTIASVGGHMTLDGEDGPVLFKVEASAPNSHYLRWIGHAPKAHYIRIEKVDRYGRLIGHRFIPTTEWEEIDPNNRDHPIQEYWDDASCFDCSSIIGGHLAEYNDIERPAWNTAFAHPTHPAWLCEDCHEFYTTDPTERT